MNAREFLESVEQMLSAALERDAPELVAACRRLAAFHDRMPYSSYPIKELLARLSGLPSNIEISAQRLDESMVAGNPELTAHCIYALSHWIVSGPDAKFSLTLCEAVHTPGLPPALCFEGRFEGPGFLPPRMCFDALSMIDLNEFNTLWTRATRDGRIDKTEAGLTCWLKAARVPAPPLAEAERVAHLLDQAAQMAAARDCLCFVDGGATAQAANVLLPLRESLRDHQEALDKQGITVTLHEDTALPPIVSRRGRLRAYWDAVVSYALWHAHSPLQVEFSFEYDATQRECGLLTEITGKHALLHATHHLAAMRRALQDHGGTLLEEIAPGAATLVGALPDPAGRLLDTWLPGWERFSQRSQQMLRLLKGGGATPPEAFILGGVLEDELERRLLPRLELPAARNLAKDIEKTAKPFANAERMTKALGQVARGKPKKDICQPVYAAELLAVLGASERGRQLLAIGNWNDKHLGAFCTTLIEAPSRPADALRWVAQWEC